MLLAPFWFTKKLRISPILILNMGDKIYILIIHVDLSCCHCTEKIQKYLCRMQCREGILGIVYDAKNNVVMINGPFCNPHELKEKLMCKLPKVIKSIEIRDPEQCDKEKCEKELEKCKKEKEKFEKELEKCKNERGKCEQELEKCKNERGKCKQELEKCKEKCDKCLSVCIVNGRPVPLPRAPTTDCWTTPASPCRPTRPCGPCSCNRSTGWNECRCSCSSCGMGEGQGGFCHGPTPPLPCNNQGCSSSNCNIIVLEDCPPGASCSIM